MQHTPVTSSNIASVGYDPATQVLEVRFSNGSLYSYTGVSPGAAEGLLNAPSKGKYFHQHIKGRYEYTQKG